MTKLVKYMYLYKSYCRGKAKRYTSFSNMRVGVGGAVKRLTQVKIVHSILSSLYPSFLNYSFMLHLP